MYLEGVGVCVGGIAPLLIIQINVNPFTAGDSHSENSPNV